MIEEKLKRPIIDFIDNANRIPNLVGVVLFGSAVTGEISKKSDIDMLLIFDTDHNPEVGEEARIAQKIATEISMKHDLVHPFSFVIVNKRSLEKLDPDFLWNVCKDGIMIWGRPEDILVEKDIPFLKPMVLVRYSISGLSDKDKRRFLRSLYSSKKRLIDKDTEKVGPGTLLLDAKKFDELRDVLDRFNVKYSMKRIWMPK